MTKIINEECEENLPASVMYKASDESSLSYVLKWEILSALDIRAKLIDNAKNTKDKCEKKGIMKAKQIVDMYINDLEEKLKQEGGSPELEFELKIIEDRAILIPIFKCRPYNSHKEVL